MPTYEYLCENCEHNFDEFQSMTADPLKTCPECNKDTLKRVIGGGAAIIFKGSGFYETDYRSDSYKDAAKKDTESATSSDTSSKSDSSSTGKSSETSKPEAKSPKSKE